MSKRTNLWASSMFFGSFVTILFSWISQKEDMMTYPLFPKKNNKTPINAETNIDDINIGVAISQKFIMFFENCSGVWFCCIIGFDAWFKSITDIISAIAENITININIIPIISFPSLIFHHLSYGYDTRFIKKLEIVILNCCLGVSSNISLLQSRFKEDKGVVAVSRKLTKQLLFPYLNAKISTIYSRIPRAIIPYPKITPATAEIQPNIIKSAGTPNAATLTTISRAILVPVHLFCPSRAVQNKSLQDVTNYSQKSIEREPAVNKGASASAFPYSPRLSSLISRKKQKDLLSITIAPHQCVEQSIFSIIELRIAIKLLIKISKDKIKSLLWEKPVLNFGLQLKLILMGISHPIYLEASDE